MSSVAEKSGALEALLLVPARRLLRVVRCNVGRLVRLGNEATITPSDGKFNSLSRISKIQEGL